MSRKQGKKNMYALSVKQWSPHAGCRHECTYCGPSFQAQLKRWAKRGCQQCYDFVPHAHHDRLDDSLAKTPFMKFIFTCASGDIAFADDELLLEIIERIRRHPDRTFLIQTKDPRVFRRAEFPSNVILGITLETNRDDLGTTVSKAPPPSERYKVFQKLKHATKMVTVEPVLDFDLDIMVRWITKIGPCMVWLGFDSRNTGLVEPELSKVRELHWTLSKLGYVVILKTIPEARLRKKVLRDSTPRPRKSRAPREWDDEDVKSWVANSKPAPRVAMWLLANGSEMGTAELNAAAWAVGLESQGGAIVGGIKAFASKRGLKSPLQDRYADGERVYRMRSKLRRRFIRELGDTFDEQFPSELGATADDGEPVSS